MDNINEVIVFKIVTELNESQRKVYICASCSYITLHEKRFNKHKKTHLPPEPRQLLSCKHCANKYRTKEGLRNHLYNKHTNSRENELKESQIKLYSCSLCVYQTPIRYYLFKHKKIHLAPEERRMFTCEHCGNKYTTNRCLQYHLDKNHIDSSIRAKALKKSQKKVHRCSKCGFQTPYQASLYRHKKVHLAREERQLFACAHCGNKYTTKLCLQSHLVKKHTDSRAKKLKKVPRQYRLNRHNKIHFVPEDRKLFACQDSDKTYMKKQDLQHHLVNNPTCSRNPDCTSVTDKVILDSLKIELDDHTPLKDEFRNTECLITTNQIKSEDLLKLEPDDVAPIQHKDLQDDFKNGENLSVAKKVKLEDFIKMEPDNND
ncbi:zinc finger protein 595-like [Sitophilus oryzae]|uniref:Zinc finger protein 595-like n=1 Tax=Sitophilus oryzae TaxID=7048 RepID=A0A6J2XW89_SITOR|nr:zinc finger protein 595-like [Sitophilus oryzae]